MSWANHYIEKLLAHETVSFRPRGNSMKGKIRSGQLVTVSPWPKGQLKKGDIVLCQVKRKQYLHLIHSINGTQFLIGNNIGRMNGWVDQDAIFGKCVRIGD